MSNASTTSKPSATESYYGLTAPPFSLTPDPRFLYHSRSHARALEEVKLALRRREGLIVVTGDIGLGKTVLCRTLLQQFEPRTFLSVVLDPRLNVEDLLQQVLVDFGLMSPNERKSRGAVDRHQLVTTLQKFLSTLIPLDAHAVIMIDEAQHLDPTVLEEIRLLTNFETDAAKLLQIVLVGQSDLDNVLNRPELRQLTQRIARRFELQPLSMREVEQYVEHRLRVATGATASPDEAHQAPMDARTADTHAVRFSPTAVKSIATLSKGTPRVINVLCHRALELGSANERRTIDRATVQAAARSLKLPGADPVRFGRAAIVGITSGLALVGAAAGWLWVSQRGADQPVVPATNVTPRTSVAPTTTVATPPADPPASPAVTRTPPPNTATDPTPADAGAVAPTAALTPAPAPTPVATRYTIMVASFRNADRTNEVAKTIEALGLPVAARFDEVSEWHFVVVGPYATREAAVVAQETLATNGFPDTRISVPRPPPPEALP